MELTYDGDTNALRLTPTADGFLSVETTTQLDGILDVGEGGRLIGVEFPATADSLRIWQHDRFSSHQITMEASGHAYIQITDGDNTTARSTPIRLTAEYNADADLIALVIPRRGDGYEITYPSGNQ